MAELGEFALIEQLIQGRAQQPAVLLGPGDDAAVIAAPDGRYVVTADMLVQDRHFRLDWSSPAQIGRKAIAQNAADIAAMGARPVAFTVALGLPGETSTAFVRELTDGMWAELERCGGSITGGDLVRSPFIVISVTAHGDLAGHAAIRRSGARTGHLVAVAGKLGYSAAGMELLRQGRADFPALIAAHQAPRPDYQLAQTAPASAMCDVSDGLLADAGHLAAASGVRIDLDPESLTDPVLIAAAGLLGHDWRHWALAGGEDHAFLATFAQVPPSWRVIGSVHPGTGVTVAGTPWTGPHGWESFTS